MSGRFPIGLSVDRTGEAILAGFYMVYPRELIYLGITVHFLILLPSGVAVGPPRVTVGLSCLCTLGGHGEGEWIHGRWEYGRRPFLGTPHRSGFGVVTGRAWQYPVVHCPAPGLPVRITI